jgi:ribosomal protein L4
MKLIVQPLSNHGPVAQVLRDGPQKLQMAIAAKTASGELVVVDATGLKPAKTKELLELLQAARGDEKARADSSRVLFIVDHVRDEGAHEIALAGRNLSNAVVIGHLEASVHAFLAHDRVFCTKNAFEALAEVCGA